MCYRRECGQNIPTNVLISYVRKYYLVCESKIMIMITSFNSRKTFGPILKRSIMLAEGCCRNALITIVSYWLAFKPG